MLKLRCWLAPLNKVKRKKRRRPDDDDDDSNDDYDGLRRERVQPNMSKEISILTQQQQNSDSCRLLTDCHHTQTHTHTRKEGGERKQSSAKDVRHCCCCCCCSQFLFMLCWLESVAVTRTLAHSNWFALSESERGQERAQWMSLCVLCIHMPEHRHKHIQTTYDHLFVSSAERAYSLSYSLSLWFSSAGAHTNTSFCDLSSWQHSVARWQWN